MRITKSEIYNLEMTKYELQYILDLESSCMSEGIGPSDTYGIINQIKSIIG